MGGPIAGLEGPVCQTLLRSIHITILFGAILAPYAAATTNFVSAPIATHSISLHAALAVALRPGYQGCAFAPVLFGITQT